MKKKCKKTEKFIDDTAHHKNPEIRALANGEPPEDTKWIKWVKRILSFTWADARCSFGLTDDEEIAKDAKFTAGIAGTAGLINNITMIPIIFLAFLDVGVIGVLTASTLFVLIQMFNTFVMNGASSGRKGAFLWSKVMMTTFVISSILYSAASAIGGIVIAGGPDISSREAKSIVSELLEGAKNVEQTMRGTQEFKDLEAECKRGQEKIDEERDKIKRGEVSRQNSDLDRLINRYEGSHEDNVIKKVDWSKVDNPPICRKKEVMVQEASDSAKLINDKIIATQVKGKTPLGVLKEAFPERYSESFTEQGQVKSALTKVEVGGTLLIEYARKGEWKKLILPLIMLNISIITSAAAILAIATFQRREDVQETKDPDRARNVEAYFDSLLHEKPIEIDEEDIDE